MDAVLAVLVSVLAMGLLAALFRGGLGLWFQRLEPNRIDRCPNCTRDNLDRGLSRKQQFGFMLLVLAWSLAVTAALFSALLTALIVITLILGWPVPEYVVQVATVLGASAIAVRLLIRPLAAIRARPPLRCRSCGHTWPSNPSTPPSNATEHNDQATEER